MANTHQCTNTASPEQIAARATAPRPALATPDGSETWYRITNTLDNGGSAVASISIYGDIGSWGITAAAFVEELKAIDAPELKINIASPGGDVFDGLAIHSALRSHRAKVIVQVDSLAASIASVIAMAGDRVIMGAHAQLMIHEAAGVTCGNAEEMREYAEFLDRQSDNIAGVYQERAGGTVKQWRARMRAETWYFADEAVEAGLADEVAKPERQPDEMPDDRAIAAAWDLSVYNYAHTSREEAPAPLVETAPEQPPAPAPAVEPPPAFDQAAFTAAVSNGIDPGPMPGFQPGQFQDLMDSVATTAPAHPEQRPAAPRAHEPTAVADEPETATEPTPVVMPGFDPAAFHVAARAAFDPMPDYDPERLRGLMAGIADDAPAPAAPQQADAPYVPRPVDHAPEEDPEQVAVGWFRSLFQGVANDAPAAPPSAAPAPTAEAPQTVYVPEPPPPADEVAVDYMRTLMANAANDLAAPEQAAAPGPAPAEPIPAIDRTAFERSLREARF